MLIAEEKLKLVFVCAHQLFEEAREKKKVEMNVSDPT